MQRSGVKRSRGIRKTTLRLRSLSPPYKRHSSSADKQLAIYRIPTAVTAVVAVAAVVAVEAVAPLRCRACVRACVVAG